MNVGRGGRFLGFRTLALPGLICTRDGLFSLSGCICQCVVRSLRCALNLLAQLSSLLGKDLSLLRHKFSLQPYEFVGFFHAQTFLSKVNTV